jgi:FixJ family two-component response regulator
VREDRPTVFVVDDDPSVRRGLERLLRSAGHRVETFGSAREFLERGDAEAGGCLVLDVRMPGQSGLELYEVLAAAGYSLPVIFITGHGDIPMAVRAIKAGAVDFLPKPFDDDALLEAVRQALARGRPSDAGNGGRDAARP